MFENRGIAKGMWGKAWAHGQKAQPLNEMTQGYTESYHFESQIAAQSPTCHPLILKSLAPPLFERFYLTVFLQLMYSKEKVQ